MHPLALLLISVPLTAFLTWLVQTFLSSRNTDLAEISEHIAEITKIEDCAVEYWTLCGDDEARDARAAVLAAKVRGMLGVTSVFRERAIVLLGDCFKDYCDLDDQLLDVATGGTFEQKSNSQDLPRAVEVMLICHKLRLLLRRAKKRRHWAH